MPLVFANPWGLLALLGIPVVLAIHFLHRHREAIPVSTLFLIEIAREPARSGRRWHRLIPSVPMWLQLLLVLLLATLLARPHLPTSALRVAVVVDDSASMRAFHSDLADALADLDRVTRRSGRATEWLVIPANPTRPRLYAGNDPAEWIATLGDWKPVEGWRDPTAALRLARERVGPDGLVVYATDIPRDNLPSGAALLSVGRTIANAGIAGVTVTARDDGTTGWQAVIVNPSPDEARREWWLEWDNANRTPASTITIPAGGMTTLEGTLPEGATRLTLRLDGDPFPLDDSFPFIRPAPKPLAMARLGEGVPAWLAERMTRSIPRLGSAPIATADFALIATEGETNPPPVAGIAFSTAGESGAPFLGDPVVSATHPLVQGLAWAGLAVQDVPSPPPAPGDVVLLWSGSHPLASLRTAAPPATDSESTNPENDTPPVALGPSGPQLVLHFNPTLSNIERLPAAAILLLRFAETIRAAKAATTWEQLEPAQSLAPFLPPTASHRPLVMETLAADGSVIASLPVAAADRAPDEPGFLRVRDDQSIWLEAAVAFADPRESDFRPRAAADTTANALTAAARQSIPASGPSHPLLILAALTALLTLYHFSAPKRDPSELADSSDPAGSPAPADLPPQSPPASAPSA